MFNTVKSLGLAASVSLLALTGAAFADMAKVSEVAVETSYASAEGTNASTYFPEIAADIAAAIEARTERSPKEEGYTVDVDIRKLALDGDFMLPDTGAFNQLEGVVTLTGTDGSPGETTAVRIAAVAQDVEPLEGFIMIAPDETDFYNAMVVGFANAVVEKIEADM